MVHLFIYLYQYIFIDPYASFVVAHSWGFPSFRGNSATVWELIFQMDFFAGGPRVAIAF